MKMLKILSILCMLSMMVTGCSDPDETNTSICGNGILEAGESCDGNDFGGLSCGIISDGYIGNLKCSPTCEIDILDCHLPICNHNGVKEAGEECDGSDLGGATCATIDPSKPNGRLGCTQKCTYMTHFCSSNDLGLQAPYPDVEQTDTFCSDNVNNFHTVNKDGSVSAWFDCKNHGCLTSPLVQVCGSTENTDSACSDYLDNPTSPDMPSGMAKVTNGLIDCTDPSCFKNWRVSVCEHVAPRWELGADCSDGIDNDGDTLMDCADPDCLHAGISSCELGERKRILFDNSHHQIAGTADWIVDVTGRHPFPSHPISEIDWHGSLSSLGKDLMDSGRYVIETLPQDRSLSYGDGSKPQDLINYDILVIVEPSSLMSTDEIKAVHDFVAAGGSLMLFADHKGADRDGNGVDSIDAINDMLSKLPGSLSLQNNPFGFYVLENGSMDSGVAGVVAAAQSHVIVTGINGAVTKVGFYGMTSFQIVNETNVFPMIQTNDGQNYVIATEYQSGRIVAFGDSAIAGDSTNFLAINNGKSGYTDFDNRILLLNAFEWLRH